MKILYIITKSGWGGASRHVFDLATAMKARGEDVTVALGGEGILKQKLDAAGVSTVSISGMKRDISIGADAGSLKQVFSVVRSVKPDVLHLHSPKAAGLGSFAGRLLGVRKILVTVHGWTWNESRPFTQRAAIVFFSWLTSIFSHRTIVICRRDLEQGRRLPFIGSKLIMIQLGIKPEALYSVDGAKQFMANLLGMSYAEYSKKIVIGTIAELHRNKGLTYLVNAMSSVVREYPQVVSVIISEGEERERLTKLIAERGLNENIRLVGFLENASQYLKAFKAFLLPSIKEGVPYTILEAGAAEVLVIASAVGGIPDIVEDGKSGILVKPGNSHDLSHAIQYSIDHDAVIKQYASALRRKVATEFSLEKMIDSLAELYRK